MDLGRKMSAPSTSMGDIILESVPLQIPSNRIELGKPYNFAWKSATDAVGYKISVGKSPLTDIIWSLSTQTETEVNYTGPAFARGAIYYWWVNAYSKKPYFNADNAIVEPDINSRSAIWIFFAR